MDDDLKLPPGQRVHISEDKHVPVGLSDLLEMVGREVLRSQPDNIALFIANILTKIVSLRDGKRESKSDLEPMEVPVPESLLPKTLVP